MNISHLIVNGCSYTYGQGLPDRLNQNWPTLLAKSLNVPCINLATPGSSNTAIHRKTYEYILQNSETGSVPLVVIAWTMYWREERFVVYNKDDAGFRQIGLLHPNRNGSFMEPCYKLNVDELGMNWHDDYHLARTLLLKHSLIQLLENLNIPYIMTDYQQDSDMFVEHIRYFKPSYRTMWNKIKENTKHLPNSIVYYTQNMDKCEDGHDGIESQKFIAGYLKNHIDAVYGNITPSGAKFIEIKDYSEELANDVWTVARLR